MEVRHVLCSLCYSIGNYELSSSHVIALLLSRHKLDLHIPVRFLTMVWEVLSAISWDFLNQRHNTANVFLVNGLPEVSQSGSNRALRRDYEIVFSTLVVDGLNSICVDVV